MTTAGDALTQGGMAAHAYAFNADMVDDYFFNADGELLIVPECGAIQVFTELGKMDVEPSEICLVPRGTMFKVTRLGEEKVWRGYLCENYGAKFRCRTVVRSAPTALPIRATSRRRLQLTKKRKRPAACM